MGSGREDLVLDERVDNSGPGRRFGVAVGQHLAGSIISEDAMRLNNPWDHPFRPYIISIENGPQHFLPWAAPAKSRGTVLTDHGSAFGRR